MLKFLSKVKMWLLAVVTAVVGVLAGGHFADGSGQINFTIIDGNCTAVVPLNTPQFYTLLSIAAVPSTGMTTTIVLTDVATFRFSPCGQVSIRSLLADAESGRIPIHTEWERRGSTYVATDAAQLLAVAVTDESDNNYRTNF